MQTIKLDVGDSFNTINAKLAEIDFTKDYKIELNSKPVIVTKIGDDLYQATRQPYYKPCDSDAQDYKWKFSSTYSTPKEILIDLFESWRVECRYEYMDM